ncbi:MAG: plastocyanin/azurin family copper-binding protein [Dehalococcoidia bacterium]|nr:plastocyanin/azurin family copper-binding protein [Dehalococcoidia bacterium]
MRRTLFLGSVLMAALMLGVVACGGGTASPTATPTKAAGVTPTGEVINIKMTESPFRFVPDTYNLEVGKTYTLVFEKAKAYHTFTIEGLTIKEGAGVDIVVNAGETAQRTITPTKAGTFKLTCVPHDALGMVGQVIVK